MSDSKHMMLAFGLFLAVLALGGVTLVWPNARQISQTRERIAELQTRSADVEQIAETVEKLSRMMRDAQQRVDRDAKIIADRPDVPSMIRRLSFPIDGEHVMDQTFNAGAVVEPLPESYPTIRAIPVTMEMKATFDSIYEVLHAVESLDRLVRPRTIRLRRDAEKVNRRGEPIIETVMVFDAVYEER
jgi:hypothetical protein